MNKKRGWITAGLFATVGFIFATNTFIQTVSLVPTFPGYFILRIFMDAWDIGHGGYLLMMITNPLFYGLIGYLVGIFSKSRPQIFYVTGLLAIILLFSSLYLDLIQPYIRHARSINQLKQQAIKKLEADPNDIGALHWMGVHHLTRTGQYQQAEKYFRKIVDLESTKADFSSNGQRSLIYLAIIYQSWGQHDKADNYYRQFIATAPDLQNDLVLLNYNNRYLKRKDKQENRSR